MSYLVVSLPEKKIGVERRVKRRAWPKKKEKKKKREAGIFVISCDKYEGMGGFLCFLPQTPNPSHAQRKRKRRGGEEEEGGGGDD